MAPKSLKGLHHIRILFHHLGNSLQVDKVIVSGYTKLHTWIVGVHEVAYMDIPRWVEGEGHVKVMCGQDGVCMKHLLGQEGEHE